MKKKELIVALIAHYKDAIENIPQAKWREFLNKKSVGFGICWCAHDVFNTDIFEKSWVKQFCNPNKYKRRGWNDYWCPPAGCGITSDGAKELLQVRLVILEKIFAKYKK
jgi:hypothetical protein